MADIKYGISVSPAGPAGNPRTMAELGALAEQSGWDGLFVEDYLVFQGNFGTPTYDPWVVLAAVAMTTNRVRLGTMVTPLPRRRPWKVAAEAVTLDHLSGGRVILGVGLGGSGDVNFSATGEPSSNQVLAERLDEGLDIIDRLWTGEPVTHHGRQYQLDGMQLRPTPVQQPRIPIWIGGDLMRAGVRQRLARWDGSCAYSSARSGAAEMIADDVRDTINLVERKRGSWNGYDVCLGGSERGPDPEKERAHIRSMAEAGATWWVEWVPPGEIEAARQVVGRGPLRID
jgi:alkanesulfonate monooxygenase SsuD/methylene tetrahydromethanopterin reductase-like flavin-dependent oxidoreductase (luciferase family)